VSPLSLAAKNGYNGICKELLDRACIKNQENIDRLTGENHRKVVKVFKEKNTTIVKKMLQDQVKDEVNNYVVPWRGKLWVAV